MLGPTGLQTADITVDEMSKVLLSNKLGALQARVAKVRLPCSTAARLWAPLPLRSPNAPVCACFPQLSQSIEKKDKEIEALRKMTAVYDNTPNFGKATDTKDVRGGPDPLALRWNVALTHMHFGPVLGTWQEENTLTHARDIMSLEKVKLEAQITLLTKAGGTHPAVSLSARTHVRAYNTELTRPGPPPPPPPTHHPPQCARLKSQSRS